MTAAPSTAPLAALLASHPEECADALAWLVERSHARGVSRSAAEQQGLTEALDALCAAGVAVGGKSLYWLAEHIDGRAIARMGAAAWLRARLSIGPRAPRYVDRETIAARIATVLGCRVGDVWLGWESSRLGRIEVGGRGLDGDDIAALIRAGFEPSEMGWDVPVDCGEREAETGAQAPKGEQR